MKNLWPVLFLVFFLCPQSADAAMVHYTDSQGRVRYVNTDFAKVPPEYMDQVKDQLQPPAPKEPAPQPVEQITPPQGVPQPLVELYVSTDCQPCRMTEAVLTAGNIKFMRFDVRQHPKGMKLYESLGGTPQLPIAKVGGKLITGATAENIQTAVHEAGWRPANATPDPDLPSSSPSPTPSPASQESAEFPDELIDPDQDPIPYGAVTTPSGERF